MCGTVFMKARHLLSSWYNLADDNTRGGIAALTKLKIESEKSLLSFSFFWDCPCVTIPTHLLWIVYCAGGRNATKIKVERPFWLYWSGSKNKMVGDKSSTIQEFFLSSFKGRMGRSARFTFMTGRPSHTEEFLWFLNILKRHHWSVLFVMVH